MAEMPHEESRVRLKLNAVPVAAHKQVLKDIVADCERTLEKDPQNADAHTDRREAQMLLMEYGQ